jgi:hypothetical protein
LEKRATKQEWWELQQAQLAYQPKSAAPKIVYPDMSQGAKFSLDLSGSLCGNTVYFIADHRYELLALLNSKLAWSHLFGEAEALRGGKWRLRMFSDDVATVPIPEMPRKSRELLSARSKRCSDDSAERARLVQDFRSRVLNDLAPPDRQKLSSKLQNFWMLDFAAFRAEVTKAFKTEIPVKDRDGWEKYLAEKSVAVIGLTAQIEAAEREIDAIVYNLFDLTPDEIKLLEAELQGQY